MSELLLPVLAGGILSIISTILIFTLNQKNWVTRFTIKTGYEKEMLKLKKKEARTDKKLAAKIKTSAPAIGVGDWINKLKGINPDMILPFLDYIQGSAEEKPAGIADGLFEFAEKNPELVQSFLEGLGTKKQEQDTQENWIS